MIRAAGTPPLEMARPAPECEPRCANPGVQNDQKVRLFVLCARMLCGARHFVREHDLVVLAEDAGDVCWSGLQPVQNDDPAVRRQ